MQALVSALNVTLVFSALKVSKYHVVVDSGPPQTRQSASHARLAIIALLLRR